MVGFIGKDGELHAEPFVPSAPITPGTFSPGVALLTRNQPNPPRVVIER